MRASFPNHAAYTVFGAIASASDRLPVAAIRHVERSVGGEFLPVGLGAASAWVTCHLTNSSIFGVSQSCASSRQMTPTCPGILLVPEQTLEAAFDLPPSNSPSSLFRPCFSPRSPSRGRVRGWPHAACRRPTFPSIAWHLPVAPPSSGHLVVAADGLLVLSRVLRTGGMGSQQQSRDYSYAGIMPLVSGESSQYDQFERMDTRIM